MSKQNANKDVLAEAQRVLQEAEEKKHKEFNDKINAICAEYGYELLPVAQIQIRAIQK